MILITMIRCHLLKHLLQQIYDGEIAFLLPERRMRFMTEKDGRVHTHRTQASFYSFWLTYKISWGGGIH